MSRLSAGRTHVIPAHAGSFSAPDEHDSFREVPLIRPDGKQVARTGMSEYSFGNVTAQGEIMPAVTCLAGSIQELR